MLKSKLFFFLLFIIGSQSSVQGEIEREAVTLMKSPAHRRQTSIDSVASIASLTDSGLPSSTANTPQETTPQGPMGFRPLSECNS